MAELLPGSSNSSLPASSPPGSSPASSPAEHPATATARVLGSLAVTGWVLAKGIVPWPYGLAALVAIALPTHAGAILGMVRWMRGKD